MTDWKSEFEARLAREAEEKRRTEEQRLREQYLRDEPKRQARANKERERWGKRFHCHVCGKPSSGPGNIHIACAESSHCGHSTHNYDASTPDDLSRCKRCNKYTCDDCRHKGVCRTCAARV